jgi:hypothetical protein
MLKDKTPDDEFFPKHAFAMADKVHALALRQSTYVFWRMPTSGNKTKILAPRRKSENGYSDSESIK